MSAPVILVHVPEDTLARIDSIRGDDTRSAWLVRLIARELAGQQATQTATGGPIPQWSECGRPPAGPVRRSRALRRGLSGRCRQ